MAKDAKQIKGLYGWHFLAKEVADYTNDTFFNILNKEAIDVLAVVMVMNAKIKLEKLNTNGKLKR